ncbi:hypothetical protein [Weissella cibaria]|uniref:hypothetical protein n=1 Tax=Weissella cibaria TaxID=137591 RepID=UPI0016468476|nr:hypothetical protein [Weissella cibaria]
MIAEYSARIRSIKKLMLDAEMTKVALATHFQWTDTYIYQLFAGKQHGPAV